MSDELERILETETDMDLQKICEEVEREFGMGGLSDGIYSDFAKEVAKRAIKQATFAVGTRGPSEKLFDGDTLIAYRHGWEQAKDGIYGYAL